MAGRSGAEEELWRQEQASWDYLKMGDLRGYLSLLHNDVMAWPRHASAPMNKDAIFQHTLPMISAFQSSGVTIASSRCRSGSSAMSASPSTKPTST